MFSVRQIVVLASVVMVTCSAPFAAADDVLLSIDEAPDHGLVVAEADLTDAVLWCASGPVVPSEIRAHLLPDGTPVPMQFVPAPDFDPQQRIAGTVLLQLPTGGAVQVRLTFARGPARDEQPTVAEPFDGQIDTGGYRLTHDPARLGGLPFRFELLGTGKVFERFRWNDRLHHRTLGSFGLAQDPRPQLERISSGPLATVVRVRARYLQSAGETSDSQPTAIYDWYYFHDSPLIHVVASATQQPSQQWDETHFLELNFPGDDFSRWACGEPLEQGSFIGETRSFRASRWGALVDGDDAIGMLDCGQVLFYDHRGGSYIQAHGDRAWQPWSEARIQWTGWLWVGTATDVVEEVRAARDTLPSRADVVVNVASVRSRIDAARRTWQDQTESNRQQTWWHSAGSAQLAERGRFQEAMQTAAGQKPADWTVLQAGELGVIFERHDHGISLTSMFDTSTGRQLLAAQREPLFEISLRHMGTKEELQLTADDGWHNVHVTPSESATTIELQWDTPLDERLGAVRVIARAVADTDSNSLIWHLEASSSGNAWALWRVIFPKAAIAAIGPDPQLFVPRAAGHVEPDVWQRAFQFGGRYPSGWTTMQYMAAYAADGATGFYTATHDPLGSTKELSAVSDSDNRSVTLSFDHPVAEMGKPGNRFELCGGAVWQLFRGDWFDAAVIYRQWVREHARWYPRRTDKGREDTPSWMRDLHVWALGGGDPKTGLPVLQDFAQQMNLPVGFHWYNWHQIPFDNDYPHYFPADDGFADAVKLLRDKEIYVMPYINGRLWDTHDRGTEDYEFSKLALSAATKDDQGQPYIETYGSEEADGNKVELAVMCPSTELWQTTVRQTVLRLLEECQVGGVYIDQVAAAKPELCFDASHDHPAGGGHWWTEAYWRMLAAIRREMPEDRILTTECNAEPYLKWFDGYLTWHWQNDGQVPAFPAVYGGAIQMFGRAYRGGETKDLALRMKAGQQLVYGEQIGWIDPGVVREPENFAFLRQIVHLRSQLARFFTAGEMGRPPRLLGEIPNVTADWQWHGQWPVTTSAVLTGAWQLPDENRAVLLLVNISDQPITGDIQFEATDYGVPGDQVQVTIVQADGPRDSFTILPDDSREITLPARSAVAWELRSLLATP